MKAIVLHEFGGPEVMQFEEISTPKPGLRDVLIEIHNVSVNVTLDIAFRKGLYPVTKRFRKQGRLSMSDSVSWVLEMAIKPGQLDNWKALMDEMVEATRSSQPDTTIYEWFYSDDGATCHIYERYTDSAATMIHLQAFGENFAERFLAAADPTRFTVYGNPNDEVRSALSGFGAVFMAQLGGYAR